jgi:RNA polymerase sigma-70 factor, ECF subfamily
MRVLPLASDAELIRGIALSGNFNLFPARRSEEIETHNAQTSALDAVAENAGSYELSDESLMTLVKTEDSDALDALFGRHSRLVYSIALRILRDPGEAEEVVQECFLYVFRKAVTFEPSRGSAKVWIAQVAYSRARDRRSHLARRGFYLVSELDPDGLDGALIRQGDVEREVGARLDCDRLQYAFDELTEIQRKTLKLFYFEDLNLREISERLREPLSNVRHHFYRGLERLRKSAIVEAIRNHHNAKN